MNTLGMQVLHVRRLTLLAIFTLVISFFTSCKQRISQSSLESSAVSLTPELLIQETTLRRLKVEEFRKIAELAKSKGYRVYIWGGAATTFANYVKLALQTAAGLTTLPEDKFDNNFFNIFRTNQDLDLALERIDGARESLEEIKAFENDVNVILRTSPMDQRKYEVRGVNTAQTDSKKDALYNSNSFKDQHTDSMSTLMIELTGSDHPSYVDLRYPEESYPAHIPRAFTDLVHGTIQFYESENHAQTERALAGMNPPLLAVIRILTKAFAFNLKLSDADSAKLQKIVTETRDEDLKSDYVRNWIEKNAIKMVVNSGDMENSFNVIENLGVRKRLLSYTQSEPTKAGSLAWWLNKEALSTDHPRNIPWSGNPTGKTARDLGISTVAHATNGNVDSFLSILASPYGKPNVLISRTNMPGEQAILGNGHYTNMGEMGYSTAGNIVYEVDPKALEGVDFLVNEEVVLWATRRYLKVRPIAHSVNAAQLIEYVKNENSGVDSTVDFLLARRLAQSIFRDSSELKSLNSSDVMTLFGFLASQKQNVNPLYPYVKYDGPESLRDWNFSSEGTRAAFWSYVAFSGKLQAVVDLLERPDFRDEWMYEKHSEGGRGAAFCAIENGHTELLSILMSSDKFKPRWLQSGNTESFGAVWAVENEKLESVRIILSSRNFNPRWFDTKIVGIRYPQGVGYTATLNHNSEILRSLLSSKHFVSNWMFSGAFSDDVREGAGYLASTLGDVELLKIMLSSENFSQDWLYSPGRRRYDTLNAGYAAAVKGHAKVVEVLLSSDKIPSSQMKQIFKDGVAYVAAINGHVDVLKVLLSSKRFNSAWMEPYLSKNPVGYVAAEKSHREVIKVLVSSQQFDLNWMVKSDPRYSRSWVLIKGQEDAVKTLLSSEKFEAKWLIESEDPNDKSYWSSVGEWAATRGYIGALETLLSAEKFDPAWMLDKQQGAASYAAKFKQTEALHLLLAAPNYNPFWDDPNDISDASYKKMVINAQTMARREGRWTTREQLIPFSGDQLQPLNACGTLWLRIKQMIRHI